MSQTALFRTEHISTDDSQDDQQLTTIYGHASEQLPNVHRVQAHGFASNPPVGSHGIGLRLSGESDLAIILGALDPTSRGQYAKNVNPGDSVLYNADGSVWSMVGKSPTFTCPQTCTLTAQSFVFKCGGVTVTISSNGVAITGGQVTHNDHDIGATHQHKDTQPGGGLSGTPQ